MRGESLLPWGVREARSLGVEDDLLAAGAVICPTFVNCAAGMPVEVAEQNAIPLADIIPGIPGSLNIPHAEACAALAAAAAGAGAEVRKGVREVRVESGARPRVRWVEDGEASEAAPRIVVGADGRNSVVRRGAGIELHRRPETHMIAGLLVGGLEGVLDDYDIIAAGPELILIGFQQPGGRLRIYLCPSARDRHRFAGASGLEEFRRVVRSFDFIRSSDALADAPAVGPLATMPGDDSWTDEPFAPGVVLIGDAAGWSSPIAGQGLSITMRDARTVRDVLLTDHQSTDAFADYVAERSERMRRLRAMTAVNAAAFADDCDDRPARLGRFAAARQDPLYAAYFGAIFAGPEFAPAEAFDGRLYDLVVGHAPVTSPVP